MIKSIIIDATHFSTDQKTGVEQYAWYLLPLITKVLLERGVSVSWIGHTTTAPQGMPLGVSWIVSPYRRFWSQTGLLSTLKMYHPDLFFTPSGLAPLRYKGDVAITIHDMAAFVSPESFTIGQQLRLRFLIRANAKKARYIFTPSQYTKQEIIRFWHLASEKVIVTPLASPHFSEIIETFLPITPESKLLVFTGRIEYKKNLLPVIEAFAKLVDYPETLLVLAGKSGFGATSVFKLVSSLSPDIQKRIVLPGYINEPQKNWLLRNAFACLVPGMVEGFGLPVLEAFHYKVPVVCAQAGSLPEVAADAALYAQGDIATDWYLQLKTLLEQPKIREDCIKKGSEYLKQFSWDETSKLTAAAFE